MIYTVTFNPSLDYIVSVPGFELGKTNRTESEQLLPGGKGINVSILLNPVSYTHLDVYKRQAIRRQAFVMSGMS